MFSSCFGNNRAIDKYLDGQKQTEITMSFMNLFRNFIVYLHVVENLRNPSSD